MSDPEVRQSFRFAAPVPVRGHGLLRPRLIEVLAGRFERRLTAVVAGAGFGKTTVLAQGLEQNELDRRGVDVWLGCSPADGSADHLLAGLADALGVDPAVATVDSVIAAVLRSAPVEVALVLDDLHVVPDPSSGLDLVLELVERLPGNGHLVIASRPPAGWVLTVADAVVAESDLAFDADELAAFAVDRDIDPRSVAGTGGWPALAELRAGAGKEGAEDFLWEEILGGLDPWRRSALEQLLVFRSFDDEIVQAVTGQDIGATELAAGLPLADVDGSAVRLHDLWQEAGASRPVHDLGVRRGAEVLQLRGLFREAFDVLDRVGDEEAQAELVARLAALDLPELHADDFAYVLGRVPLSVRSGPYADLLRAQMLLGVDGEGARAALGDSAAGFAARGDDTGEARALAHKLWLHSWDADIGAMAQVYERLTELSEAGSERARRSVDLMGAYMALVAGEPQKVVALVEPTMVYDDPVTSPTGGFLLAAAHLDMGEPEAALAAARAARPLAQGRLRVAVVGSEFEAQLLLGLPDEATVRSDMAELMALCEAYGVAENQAQVLAGVALVSAEYGWASEARTHLWAAREAEGTVGARVRPAVTMAAATLCLVEGDEDGAVEALRSGLAVDPLGDRPNRAYLRSLATLYVLLAETRPLFDAMALGPAWAFGRSLAQALVMARGDDPAAAAAVDWTEPARIRGSLAGPLTTELAVAGLVGGNRDAGVALEGLPFDTRSTLRRLADTGPEGSRAVVEDLLATVPVPPTEAIEIRVLGTLELWRGVARVNDAEWSHDRVRALLQLLVDHRRITRRAAAEAIWPELEAWAAGDNLRVNLNHLHRALQPDRQPQEASWFLRADEDHLALAPSAELVIDVDEFDREVAAGRDAEEALDPLAAIGHYRRAVARRRGEYLVDAPFDDWGEADRARLRQSFVDVAVRAGELLLALGDHDEAARLGAQATEADPFVESAYRLSARALRLSGDRIGGWRLLTSAVAMLQSEGLEPDPQTRRDLQDLIEAD